jgi:hypothetical protein
MAHRREHEEAPGGRRAKTWVITAAIVAALALAALATVLSLW